MTIKNILITCLCVLSLQACVTNSDGYYTANECERQSFFATIADIDTGAPSATLHVKEIVYGCLTMETEISIKNAQTVELLRHFGVNENLLFVSCCKEDIYTTLIPVYDIAPDRYAAVLGVLNEMSISFYTDDFSSELLWVPKSCRDEKNKCQYEIDLIKNEYNLRNGSPAVLPTCPQYTNGMSGNQFYQKLDVVLSAYGAYRCNEWRVYCL